VAQPKPSFGFVCFAFDFASSFAPLHCRMELLGPVVHQQLLRGYQAIQADLESVRGHVAARGAQISELTDDRSRTLVALAQHYLPELTAEAIQETWSEVRPDVRQILLRKGEHQQRNAAALQATTAARQEQETRLAQHDEQLDELLEQQQSLSEQLSEQLADDENFAKLSNRAAAAEAALQQAEGRLAGVEQDAAQKLPAYEQSSLFQYLYRQGFGTPAYDRRGLTRRMDRWVGQLIGFYEAKKSFEFLRDTPQQMKAIVAEDREALETVMQELERQRDEAAAALGLDALLERVERTRVEREQVIGELDSLRLQLDSLRSEQSELEDTRGPYYREAVELFRSMLSRTSGDALSQRARHTPEITDDQIVARLEGVDTDLTQIDNEVSQRRQQIRDLDQQLQELGRLVQNFRAAGYESTRSTFRGTLDMADLLKHFRQGHTTADSIWVQIRRVQQFGPTTMERVSQVAAHPMTQVLIHAMAHAAGQAMSGHARHAGHRRVNSRQHSTTRNRPAAPPTPSSRGQGQFRTRDYL